MCATKLGRALLSVKARESMKGFHHKYAIPHGEGPPIKRAGLSRRKMRRIYEAEMRRRKRKEKKMGAVKQAMIEEIEKEYQQKVKEQKEAYEQGITWTDDIDLYEGYEHASEKDD